MNWIILIVNIFVLYFTILGILLALYFPARHKIEELCFHFWSNSKYALIDEQIAMLKKKDLELRNANPEHLTSSHKILMPHLPKQIGRYERLVRTLRIITFGIANLFM